MTGAIVIHETHSLAHGPALLRDRGPCAERQPPEGQVSGSTGPAPGGFRQKWGELCDQDGFLGWGSHRRNGGLGRQVGQSLRPDSLSGSGPTLCGQPGGPWLWSTGAFPPACPSP